jgi:hypothetical protein
MKLEHLELKFAAMGARLKGRLIPSRWQQGDRHWLDPVDYAIDIQRDRRGEFFELRVPTHLAGAVDVSVLQIREGQRQLLLLARKAGEPPQVDRFLCGHDERHWFVAAVPGRVSNVADAMESLKPAEVQAAQVREGLGADQRNRRHNPAFRRQGEWFFVPAPGRVIDPAQVLRNEPIRRGRGKPHLVQELARIGGARVYVCPEFPDGLTEEDYQTQVRGRPDQARLSWRLMVRDAAVHARGTVRHPDHATLTLPGWHRVLMNTENQSRTMANVAFLD